MQFEVSAEDINKAVVAAIVNSSIGEALKTTIDEEVRKLTNRYDNPFKAVINHELDTMIKKIVMESYQPIIEQKVREAMTDKVIAEIASHAISTWIHNPNR